MDGSTSPAVRERVHVVVAGHVDHGKSTVIGRLLCDSGLLPEGKLEQVRALCERTARPFEYAFLLDALKDEQSQGITIDAARVFFKTARRDYLVLDAPGHIEFLRNMVTGASRAEAALLVIDGREGVQENSCRHGYLLSMLGIRQIAVLVNKMDLCGHDPAAFLRVVKEYGAFLRRIGVTPACFVPIEAREGGNIARRSAAMPWYEGPTVLEVLEGFAPARSEAYGPLRLPVQDVYKFTAAGDERRIIAGNVESGCLEVGDEIVFLPSGKRGQVRSLEGFARPPTLLVCAGQPAGFTLSEQIYVGRGEVACRVRERPPQVARRLRVSLFWLGRRPLEKGRGYLLKLGTGRVPVEVEAIHRVIDAADLRAREGADGSHRIDRVERNEVAECTLALGRPLCFDLVDEIAAMGRFVLVDEHEIRGGGIVREALPDLPESARGEEGRGGAVSRHERRQRHGGPPALLLLCGPPGDPGPRALAAEVEGLLFTRGRAVYDLKGGAPGLAEAAPGSPERAAALRRLGDLAAAFLDAGLVLLAVAPPLHGDELGALAAALGPDPVVTAWVGPGGAATRCDLLLTDPAGGSGPLLALLDERGLLHLDREAPP